MKLTGIAIQKYRSIKRTPRLNLGDMTVLIGPNNEGKSNILRALAVSMKMLRQYGYARPVVRGNTLQRTGRMLARDYDWQEDYPKDLQATSPEGKTIIDLWFELTSEEKSAFTRSVGSRLNTELPIRLTIGRYVEFSVRKQGRGGATLTKKADKVAQFVGRSLRVEYVESFRTAARAHEVVRDMMELELEALSEEQSFADALNTLTNAVKPVTDRLSRELEHTLRDFLPDVNRVEIGLATDRVLAALSGQTTIVVDDGVATELHHKGDGVQSLAALALVRKAATGPRGALFLTIEEPEAHLHPRAIHQLRTVLTEIAVSQQVVLTTHSPLLANRHDVQSNILVRSNRASPASSLRELREALGVRVSDNLSHASLVLLVEGGCDSNAMNALLVEHSQELDQALQAGLLAIESLGSSSNLSARLDALRAQLCTYHVLVDDDIAGREAAKKARDVGLLSPSEENFVIVPGQKESEFEDALDVTLYRDEIHNHFGVDLDVKEFRQARHKWSERVAACFRAQGKNWDDKVQVAVKTLVSLQLAQHPGAALHPNRAQSIVALISELERRVRASS